MDGAVVVIDIDEFWKALGDDAFRRPGPGRVEDLPQTKRLHGIWDAVPRRTCFARRSRTPSLEQCATKIFLPNPARPGARLRRRVSASAAPGISSGARGSLAPDRRQFLDQTRPKLRRCGAQSRRSLLTIWPSSPAAPRPWRTAGPRARRTSETPTRTGRSPFQTAAPRPVNEPAPAPSVSPGSWPPP